MTNGKRVNFCFAGGGARASFQAGVLKGLVAGGILPSFISANSAGSLNAFVFSRCGIEYLERVWRDIKNEGDIFTGNAWVTLPWKTGKMSPKPLKLKLQKALEHAERFHVPFAVTTVSLLTGEVRYTDSDHADILNMTAASASIPGYVECYQPDTFAWSDGGTKENLPLARALVDKPDLVVCLHCSPADPRRGDGWKPGNPIHNGLRAIEMATEENYKADRFFPETVPIIDIFPEFAVLDVLDFDQSKITPSFDYGYNQGINALPGIRALLGGP